MTKKGFVYIVAGVSGSGKTTIGKVLAKELSLPFYDADDFHSEANIQKMKDGESLNEKDRQPWLFELSELIAEWHYNDGAVLACSALKKTYRNLLSNKACNHVQWIFLDYSEAILLNRIRNRKGHFFDQNLLTSQIESFEAPDRGIIITNDSSVKDTVNTILNLL